jgi:hypothetical protein
MVVRPDFREKQPVDKPADPVFATHVVVESLFIHHLHSLVDSAASLVGLQDELHFLELERSLEQCHNHRLVGCVPADFYPNPLLSTLVFPNVLQEIA